MTRPMIILGVTGSMAMGKSTITQMLRLVYHIPTWDADQEVRDLLIDDQELIQEISKRYPEVVVLGKVDRDALRSLAFKNEACLKTLEHLIHPRAFVRCKAFLQKMRSLSIKFCALDVPLLFEVGWDKICTHTVVVYAPSCIQRQRLQKRLNLNERNIARILSRQWPVTQKRGLATYEIQTGLSKANTFRQLNRMIVDLRAHA